MERKLAQDKLAEKAGCSVRTITDIEGGTVGMSIERLPTLRRLLHTPRTRCCRARTPAAKAGSTPN